MTEYLPEIDLRSRSWVELYPLAEPSSQEAGINMSWKNKRGSSWQSNPYVFAFHNDHESMSKASFLLEKGCWSSVVICLGHHGPLQLVLCPAGWRRCLCWSWGRNSTCSGLVYRQRMESSLWGIRCAVWNRLGELISQARRVLRLRLSYKGPFGNERITEPWMIAHIFPHSCKRDLPASCLTKVSNAKVRRRPDMTCRGHCFWVMAVVFVPSGLAFTLKVLEIST